MPRLFSQKTVLVKSSGGLERRQGFHTHAVDVLPAGLLERMKSKCSSSSSIFIVGVISIIG